jgi:hypothetical protein
MLTLQSEISPKVSFAVVSTLVAALILVCTLVPTKPQSESATLLLATPAPVSAAVSASPVPSGATSVGTKMFIPDEFKRAADSAPQYSNTTKYSNATPISSSNYSSSSYSGGCTMDCSGHNAGYEWAQENNITDTSYSNGNSESFNEGVQAYAQENQ